MKAVFFGTLVLVSIIFTNPNISASEISTVELMYTIKDSSLPESCHLEQGEFSFRDEQNEFLKIIQSDNPQNHGLFFSSSLDGITVTQLGNETVEYTLKRNAFKSIETSKYQTVKIYDRSEFKMIRRGSVILSLEYLTKSSNGMVDRNFKVSCER